MGDAQVRDAVQLVVHERGQAAQRCLVAVAPGQQQLGEVFPDYL